MKKRFLVTGCAGFIGARTTALLLDQGHEVVGVDDLNDAYDPALKEWRLRRFEARPSFAFHRADVASRSAMMQLFDGVPFDAVVNLAARAGVRQSIENPQVYVDTNMTGTLVLLEQCRDHGVRKFLLASTSSLYGNLNPTPFREDANTDRPLSPYAASKKGAEALVASFAHLYGIDSTVVRYFTVYGPAGRPDMSIFRFIRQIAEGEPIVVYGDGKQERDFTFVDDIARGTVAAIDRAKGFEVINLGSDRPVGLDAVIRMIEKELETPARVVRRPFHPADIRKTWADISKARKILGWQPHVHIEEGVRLCVGWYRANAAWARKLRVEDN
jgi:dTDP-glucose 4,6-dehydratase